MKVFILLTLPRAHRCSHDGCNKKPTYGIEGQSSLSYCAQHVDAGMSDVIPIRCIHETCRKRPKYGVPGSKKVRSVFRGWFFESIRIPLLPATSGRDGEISLIREAVLTADESLGETMIFAESRSFRAAAGGDFLQNLIK